MPKIAHLADIHWRGLSRHQEYRGVFERVFADLRELKPDIIFIGGDIVHSKTQGISPELIDCLVWWFNGLAAIAPTHVILGNHDGIILNHDRQDAISPLISALANDRIFLYKKSGVYPMEGFPGFNWCIFSCFDEDGWKDVKPVPGEVNIATFHGPVWGSRTEIDWKIEGDVDIKFFEDYDFSLLGDIHRLQYLTPDRRLAYCGSTIQQNYGEEIEKGYLFWDIKDRNDFDVTFRKIPGIHPFITVEWAGNVTDTIRKVKFSDILPSSRIRISSKDPIQTVEWKQLCSELEIEKSPCEIVSKDERDNVASRIATDSITLHKDDLRDPDVHVKLISDFFKENEITPYEREKIQQLSRGFIAQVIKSDEYVRGTKWSVKKLEFDNTFLYGENNIINFDNLFGITGVFGRNAKGKSSIVGSLMYVLFNTTDRGPIKNIHVINTRKNHCLAKVTLAVDGDLFRFERQSVKQRDKAGVENAVTHLNVMRVDEAGEILEDQSYEQRRVTEQYVRSRIGTSDDFLLTSLASQGEMNSFIKHRNTMRKMILTRFLGLDVFEKMAELARDESKNIQAQVKNVPDRDWDALIVESAKEKEQIVSRLLQTESEMQKLRNEENATQQKLSTITNAGVITQTDVDIQASLLASIEKTIQEINDRRTSLLIETSKIKTKLTTVDELKTSTSIDELRAKQHNTREMEKSITSLRHEYDRELTHLGHQERSVSKLKDVPCGDAFPACKFIKDSHSDRSTIEDQRRKVAVMLDNIDSLQSNFTRLVGEGVDEKIRKYDLIIRKESDLKVDLARRESEIHTADTSLCTSTSKLDLAKTELDEMKRRVVNIDVSDELSQLKLQIGSIRSKIAKIDAERILLANRSGRLESTSESHRQEKEKYQDLKEKWRIYDLFMQAVSKRGIPLQIIMSQLPLINAEISKILQSVVAFTVELEADPNSNEMDVFINYGDSRRIIEVASGMEKMIASLAIRVALINVSSLPKTDMLVIDEGFGTLDDVNVEACNRLLESLKKWFKNILIITHIDGVKDVVDNVIDITWTGKDAHVVCE